MSLFARDTGPARALRARVPTPRPAIAQRRGPAPLVIVGPAVADTKDRPGLEERSGPVLLLEHTLPAGVNLSVSTADPPESLRLSVRASAPVSVDLATPSRVRGQASARAARRAGSSRVSAAPETAVASAPEGADVGVSDRSLRDRLRAVLAPPVAALLPRAGSILDWPSSLHPFQLDGVRVLLAKPEVLLADDMGLGKTVQAIAALRILQHGGKVGAALVVVPAGLVHQWRQELTRWAPELRVSTVTGSPEQRGFQWSVAAHVFLVTYETLRSDLWSRPSSGPRSRAWGVMVLDEAQKIKNRGAGVSVACKMVPRRRSWALTGTPLENSVDDLVSILEFLQPNPEGEPVRPLRFDVGLLERQKAVQLRRRKIEVLTELPPKTVNRVLLDLSVAQMSSYRRAEEEGVLELRQRGETLRLTHVLQLITRLKQICNFCPETGASAKLIDLAGRLQVLSDEGHKALIFSQYTDDVFGVRAIERGITAFGPLTYTGDLSSDERTRRITRFKSDPSHRALVLSLRAGGQGLNLQEASYVFHFDRWWNPAIERQAEDRSHRLGQTVPVTVYTYTCADTIEDRIARLLEEKQRLFDNVVDEVSMDIDRLLSAEEIFGLFGLRPSSQVSQMVTIAPRSFFDLTGREFEECVAGIFRVLGFKVELTPQSRDGGVDLVARQVDVVGVETSLYVQCKNHAAPVGVETVRALLGSLPANDPGARAVLACPAGFSADAKRLAADRGVQLLDDDGLRRLVDRVPAPPHQSSPPGSDGEPDDRGR